MNPPTSEVVAVVSAVPMSGADVTDAEVAAVVGVLRSGCLSIGPRTDEFERQVAALTGAKHAVAVSSGTAGLHLAVIAAGVESGDLVLTTPFSFVASANCVLYERAIPIFVDVDPVTGNIDPDLVERVARDLRAGGEARERWLPPARRGLIPPTARLKAIVPVHAFGQPADMDPLVDVARASDVALIEDACEAIGSTYKFRPVGAIGDAGVFAFYPNKQMTTGEGGVIVTNRDAWASLFRSLRNQGRDTMDAWLRHERLGFNYRMDELSAALGTAQLSRFEALVGARDTVAGWYRDRLAGVPGVELPAVVPSTTRMSWFAYVVRLAGVNREKVIRGLAEHGIPSRTYFNPIHLQPFYAGLFGYRRGDFPVTEALGDRCLALPFSATLTEAQVDRVCDALTGLVAQHSELGGSVSLLA
ncbi:MAG: DegT/DnrJ/EryC1/StrS family aminotransferase [Vicinamibacterales bacterium]